MRPERLSQADVRPERVAARGVGVVGVGVRKEDDQEDKEQQQQQTTDRAALVEALGRLNPPFVDAAAWLQTAPEALVAGWLRYLEGLDGEARRGIRNESAFLRSKIAAGAEPPVPGAGAGRPVLRGSPGMNARATKCAG
jgi:hypothetical protein